MNARDAYARSYDELHGSARVVSCVECARSLAWIDMLTLAQAGWTKALDGGRLRWRCPDHPAPERAPLTGQRESETAGGEPRAKRAPRAEGPRAKRGERARKEVSRSPVQLDTRALERAIGLFLVERQCRQLGFAIMVPHTRGARLHAPRGVDGRALCGVSASQTTIEMHAAWYCRRCAARAVASMLRSVLQVAS